MKHRGWLAAVGALLCACGGSNVEESVDDLTGDICDAAFRCCSRGEINVLLGPFVDETNCAERLRRTAELQTSVSFQLPIGGAEVTVPNVAVLARAVDEGRAELDGDAVAACLAYLRELSCNTPEVVTPPEGCQPPQEPEETPCDPTKMVIGKVESGDACTSPNSTLECREGLTCRAVDSLGVEGVCVAPGNVGEFCFFDSDCLDDLYCSLLDGTCQVPRTVGETCLYSDEDDLTPSQSLLLIECEPGLSCDPVTDTCVAACSRGAACSFDSQCDDTAGLICITGRCDEPRASGQPCSNADDCQDGLRCAVNPADPSEYICQALLANGDSCSTIRPEDCDSGFCDPSTFQCAAASSPGGLCPTNRQEQCAGGYCEDQYLFCTVDGDCATLSGTCNTTFNRCEYYCIALQPDGATCLASYECASQNCINGFCRTIPLADGQPCDFGAQCESGFCNYENPRQCATLPLANGSTCALDSECASGVCHQNSCQNGLSEGADCSSSLDPPCGRGLYCDYDQTPPLCVALLEAGSECDSSIQCWGSCVTRFGRRMCDATPEDDAAVCDGL